VMTIPISKLGAGKHDVELYGLATVSSHKAGHVTVHVDVPADMLTTQLVVSGCDGSSDHATVDLSRGWTACAFGPDMSLKVTGIAAAGAKVTIGTHTVTVPASGALDTAVEPGDLFFASSFEQLNAIPFEQQLPWRVETGSSAGTGTLMVRVGNPLAEVEHWLRAVIKGSAPHPAFTHKGGRVVVTTERELMLDPPKRPLSEVSLIALATDVHPTTLEGCRYANQDGSLGVENKHITYDAEVAVYDVATWKIVDTKTFPGTRECPASTSVTVIRERSKSERLAPESEQPGEVHTKASWKDVADWLATVAIP